MVSEYCHDSAGFRYTDYTRKEWPVHLADLAFLAPFWNLNRLFESCSLRKETQPTSKDVINVPNNKAVALEKWYLSNRLILTLLWNLNVFFLLIMHASTIPTHSSSRIRTSTEEPGKWTPQHTKTPQPSPIPWLPKCLCMEIRTSVCVKWARVPHLREGFKAECPPLQLLKLYFVGAVPGLGIILQILCPILNLSSFLFRRQPTCFSLTDSGVKMRITLSLEM